MKRIIRIICVISAAVLLIGGLTGCGRKVQNVSSEDGWTQVVEKQTLCVGVYSDRFPMCYANEDSFIGYDIDLITEIAFRLGVKIEFVDMEATGETPADLLNEGKIDCAIGAIVYTAELERQYILSDPYLTDQKLLIILRDSEITDLSDFVDKALCMTKTTEETSQITESPLFLSSFSKIDYTLSDAAAVNMVMYGESDAAIVNQTVADYYINNGKKICYLGNDNGDVESFGSVQYVMAFALKNKVLQKKAAEAYATMIRDGVTDSIQTKWFGRATPADRTKEAYRKAEEAAQNAAETVPDMEYDFLE